MRSISLDHQFVEYIPENLVDGVLYISQRYNTAAHKCCCGCGEEVVTPLTPTDWHLWIERDAISLNPSIGNWGFSCRSHYFIRKSRVVWAGDMSQSKIEQGRAKNIAIKQAYYSSENNRSQQHKSRGLVRKAWQYIKRWLNF